VLEGYVDELLFVEKRRYELIEYMNIQY